MSSHPLSRWGVPVMTGKVYFTRLLQSCTLTILMKTQLFSVSSTTWPQLISVHIPSDVRKRLRRRASAMPACTSTALFKTKCGHVKPSWTSMIIGSTSSYQSMSDNRGLCGHWKNVLGSMHIQRLCAWSSVNLPISPHLASVAPRADYVLWPTSL